MSSRRISHLYRYPMKGFSEEALARVDLAPASGFPMDRALAVTDGNWTYDPATYVPKNKLEFIGLMQHPSIARLRLRADAEARQLSFSAPGGERFTIDASQPDTADAFIDFLMRYLGLPPQPRPSLVKGEGGAFTDFAMLNRDRTHKGDTRFAISVINLASLRELEAKMGKSLDPLRFRANIYYEGGEPWEETQWFGRFLTLGGVTGKVIMSTPRCAIPAVNPVTGERDANVLQGLLKHYKHKDLGFYVDAVSTGTLALGDGIEIAEGVAETHSLLSVPLNGVSYSVYVDERGAAAQRGSVE